MSTLTPIALALITLTILTGCVSATSPERPRYTGLDKINNAKRTQLIGEWSATELNPIANTESQTTFVEYRNDGTVSGTVPASKDSPSSLNELELSLSGNWTLEADVVIHRNMMVQSTDDSELGLLLNRAFENQAGMSSRANIYEISDNRIVMVGDDGKAVEYTRQ